VRSNRWLRGKARAKRQCIDEKKDTKGVSILCRGSKSVCQAGNSMIFAIKCPLGESQSSTVTGRRKEGEGGADAWGHLA